MVGVVGGVGRQEATVGVGSWVNMECQHLLPHTQSNSMRRGIGCREGRILCGV